jgi:hypothetical protein
LRTEFVTAIKELLCDDLNEVELDCVSKVFGKKNNGGCLMTNEIIQVLVELGVKEKIPDDRKHLKFSLLDSKSIRILNRLNNFLKS